jgi:hypothetical protein
MAKTKKKLFFAQPLKHLNDSKVPSCDLSYNCNKVGIAHPTKFSTSSIIGGFKRLLQLPPLPPKFGGKIDSKSPIIGGFRGLLSSPSPPELGNLGDKTPYSLSLAAMDKIKSSIRLE